MLKRILLLLCIMSLGLNVLAEEVTVNLTPAKKFSGVTNKASFKYPPLSVSDLEYDEGMAEMIEEGEIDFSKRPVSARQIVNQDPDALRRTPAMNYSNFPQNYDSSNSMMMMQGGMQSMFNQIGY